MTAALENLEDVYPLSPVQAGMLFHCISGDAAPSAYIGQTVITLDGAMNEIRFERAWRDTVAAHDALRASFVWEELDAPVQAIRAEVDLPWRVVAGDATTIGEICAAERDAPFSLTDAPLMRFLLVREHETRHHLIWTCHHLISDGWSHRVLLDEALSRYDAMGQGAAPLRPPTARYRDYLAWLQSRNRTADEAYWRGALKHVEGPTSLRLDRKSVV